jgi:hypothetical protein
VLGYVFQSLILFLCHKHKWFVRIGAWIDEFLPYAVSNLKGIVHLTETLQQILQVSTVGILGHLILLAKLEV